MNTFNYQIIGVREMEPNVYLVTCKKGDNNKIKEEPLFKHFIVDATKDEKSASFCQINLPFDKDSKNMEMQYKYPLSSNYFIDLG